MKRSLRLVPSLPFFVCLRSPQRSLILPSWPVIGPCPPVVRHTKCLRIFRDINLLVGPAWTLLGACQVYSVWPEKIWPCTALGLLPLIVLHCVWMQRWQLQACSQQIEPGIGHTMRWKSPLSSEAESSTIPGLLPPKWCGTTMHNHVLREKIGLCHVSLNIGLRVRGSCIFLQVGPLPPSR